MRTPYILFPLLAQISIAAGRMTTPRRRATDTCANISLRLDVLFASVDVQVCACIGQLDAVISSNGAISGAVGALGGLTKVKATITTAIDRESGKCSCSYPEHAIPACSKSDLCDFKCPIDRIKVDKQCHCRPGKYDCNGKCSSQPCSSQRPSLQVPACPTCIHLRDEYARDKRNRHHGIPNWARRSLRTAHCPVGTEMCGVFGRPDGWECIRVEEDLESCGGCATPFFSGQVPGVDCSALLGVDSVGCIKGVCEVSKCSVGWKPSADGRSCERNSIVPKRGLVPAGSSLGKGNGSSETDSFRYSDW
ncbi:Dihydroxyacetone synthase [Ceratobasidium sp. 428]|nr:Dihydroxyacetone synthase [Ceratobasidium sp. 428]